MVFIFWKIIYRDIEGLELFRLGCPRSEILRKKFEISIGAKWQEKFFDEVFS